MRWWDYAVVFAAIAVSVGLAGLMGAWSAERRLDRLQERELRRPRLNDQSDEDLAERGQFDG